MDTIYKVAAILVFPKYAVYLKLNYFKLIHLQANMLSSLFSTYFAVNHTNLPQNCHLGLENTRFRTQSQGGCYILHPKGAQWLNGRMLDSRPRGHGFEPHRRHCVVVLEQDTFILA